MQFLYTDINSDILAIDSDLLVVREALGGMQPQAQTVRCSRVTIHTTHRAPFLSTPYVVTENHQ